MAGPKAPHNDGPPPLDPPETELVSRSVVENYGSGDVILINGLPEIIMVGCDSFAFTSTAFGGIRDIPPGPHFFWVGQPGGTSTRSGCWFFTGSGDQVVHDLAWDSNAENLVLLKSNSRRPNTLQTSKRVVSYTDLESEFKNKASQSKGDHKESFGAWSQLTDMLGVEVLDRIIPTHLVTAKEWIVHTTDQAKGVKMMNAELKLNNALSHPLLETQELDFAFSQDSKTYSLEVTGQNRTIGATDATSYIERVINEKGLGEQFLCAEFQFAFIVGMHLGNDDCIRQWWHVLVKLFLKAYTLIEARPTLVSGFLRCLAAQLTYSEEYLDHSFLDYSDDQGKELRLTLTVYKRRLGDLLSTLDDDASPGLREVVNAFSKVEAVAAMSLGWDIGGNYLRRGKVMLEDGEEVELELKELEAEDERGEYAPEVVALDEDGRQADLVSWS